MSGWVLAIDFGTTNTVASIADASGGVRTLNVDGRPVMPSAVFLEKVDRPGFADSWTVGERAVNLAHRRLEQFEANPKRCVADGMVFLGGRDVPVQYAIAALLTPIVDEAARQFSKVAPAKVIVTHPASWAADRVEILRQAVRAATGDRRWPEPDTLAEPVAAAQRLLGVPELPAHARLAVLDFGGGTVDVSVVDRHDDTVTVAGLPTGIDSLGGEDFDLRLAEWMYAEAGRPGLFRYLAHSPDPDARERAVEQRKHARTVKEELSKRTVVPGQVRRSPPELMQDTAVQVSRPDLEALIIGGPGRPPGLVEAVDLVDRALRQTPPGPPFAGVFLVGGSSRINRLGALISEKTGRPPIEFGDPTTAVADGAAYYALRQLDVPAPAPDPASPPPEPVTKHAAPRSRRRTAVVLVVLAVLLGGVGAAYAANSGPQNYYHSYTCLDGTVVSYSYECPTQTTTPATSRTTSSGGGLAACSTTSERSCAAAVLANSRRVWPAMATAGDSCKVYDGFYSSGVDRFTAECSTSSYNYIVIWRSLSVDFPAVVNMYEDSIGNPPSKFTLNGSSAVLGQQVRGSASTNGTPLYLCVWEYAAYPVAMVIEGADDNDTPDECADTRFLTPEGMDSLFS